MPDIALGKAPQVPPPAEAPICNSHHQSREDQPLLSLASKNVNKPAEAGAVYEGPLSREDSTSLLIPKEVVTEHSLGISGAPVEVDEAEEAAHMRRVIFSSIIGNTLEWYDFLVYSYSASVISSLFFPLANRDAQLIAFYGVFAAGFLTRPLGALFFGYVGDRYSRKTALMASIYMMAVPTFLMGCLPTYQQVGIFAPILLMLIRIIQGFAVGGEFTATMVFLVEHAKPSEAGLQGSWAFFSVMVGVITGSVVSTIFHVALTDEQLHAWGWRLPFFLSIIGAAIGIYIRRHLREPDADTDSSHIKQGGWKNVATTIALVVLIDFMTAIGFYLTVIFMPTFLHEYVGLSRPASMAIHTANMVAYAGIVPLGGWLSDRYGRVKLIVIPSLAMMVLAWPTWALLRTHNPGAAWFSQFILCVMMALFSGVVPVTFVTLFKPQYRCLGVSLGHNISMAVFGGTAPLIATALIKGTQSMMAPAGMLIVAGALSALGGWLSTKRGIK